MQEQNKRWEMRFPKNYQEYLTLTESYSDNGFKRREKEPIPINDDNIHSLENLTKEGYDTVGIVHFDEKGKEVKGMMEVYLRERE